MTEQVPQQETPSDDNPEDSFDSGPYTRPPTASHLRPIATPRPEQRLFTNPAELPIIRARPLPVSKSEQTASQPEVQSKVGLPDERIEFPVASAPPRIRQPLPQTQPRPESEVAKEESEETVEDVEEDEPAEVVLQRSPLFGFVLLTALAIGTLPLNNEGRYLLLWLVMLVMGVFYVNADDESGAYTFESTNLVWGAGTGFVVSLPLLLLVSRGLAQTSHALLPIASNAALFQALVITWPLGESLYYRGAVQNKHGLVVAAMLAGAGNMLLYWPLVEGVFAVLFVAVLFATILAFIYGYVRLRYGLMAAYTCQVVANVMLLFLPRLLVVN